MKPKILTLITTLSFVSTMALADINPKDGLWKAKMTSSKVTGCPSMMKSMLDKQGMKEMSKNVTFDKPFHPRSLFEESGQLSWKKTGTNKWQAVMNQSDNGVSVNGMSVNITWSVGVVSDTKMNVSSNVSLTLPAQMAAMLGGSGQCNASATGTYNYVSN